MADTSKVACRALAILAATALVGCIQVKAPESVDVDLGRGTSRVGDRQPAPADADVDQLYAENLALRRELDEARAELKKARRQVDDLEEELEDVREDLKAQREAMERAHGGDDDDDD